MIDSNFDKNSSHGRMLPVNVDAEMCVLSALLIDNNTYEDVALILNAESFYKPAHRIIYDAISHLINSGQIADMTTLTDFLAKKKLLDNVGGVAYLAELFDKVPTAANVVFHANIVNEKHIMRELISLGTDLVQAGFESELDAKTLLDNAEQKIFHIAEKGIQRDFTHIKTLLSKVANDIDAYQKSGGFISGLTTGFTDLDNMTTGFHPGELIIIGARPSMGKTAFCLNIAQHVSIEEKKTVAIFSLEMSKESLAMRLLCSEARISMTRLKSGKIDSKDWNNIIRAGSILDDAPIYIDDTPAINILELKTKARRLKRHHGLDLIIVDYLQLMEARTKTDNQQQAISQISRDLKATAKELQVPVIALSQLNRSVENRSDRRPMLSDLRESGAIEQDADLVLFIHREEYYKRSDEKEHDNIAEIIIGKQRNGPTGIVQLIYLKDITKFENKTNLPFSKEMVIDHDEIPY